MVESSVTDSEISSISPYCRVALCVVAFLYFMGIAIKSVEMSGAKIEFSESIMFKTIFVIVQILLLVVVVVDIAKRRNDQKIYESQVLGDIKCQIEEITQGITLDAESRKMADLFVKSSQLRYISHIITYLVPVALGLACVGHYVIQRFDWINYATSFF